mgnify:CR=1 FL=1
MKKITKKMFIKMIDLLQEIKKKVKNLKTKFPVRASDDFDDGRLSMQREVLNIIDEKDKEEKDK